MPSTAYRRWTFERAAALDQIAQAHAAVGGTGRGRRYATQQVNHAYAVLLASQFQGFCRDLHSECVERIVAAILPATFHTTIREEMTWNRQLDRGNAHAASVGADYGRLEIDFWAEVDAYNSRTPAVRAELDRLNAWRNAIAHQDFDPARLGGTTVLRLARVRRWRSTCSRLARDFDGVMGHYLRRTTGTAPW